MQRFSCKWQILHTENKCFLLYNKIGDKMKYMRREILQEKLKQIRHCPLTCFYAPRGSGKTKQIKGYLNANRVRRKWIDLLRYPLHNEEKIADLKIACMQLDPHVILILEHYTAAYTAIVQELVTEQRQPVLLISDEMQDSLHKNWNYIDLHDISLSKQELSAVCVENEISMTQEGLEIIHDATFGWIPAVEVYLKYYQHYQEIMETEHLYMVVRDIYQQVSKHLKKLLPVLSLCNSFSRELCLDLGASASVIKELDKLAVHGWLIRKTIDQQYEVAAALQYFLKRELQDQHADIRQLHITFARWFEQHHQIIAALYHYDQAMEYKGVLRILEDRRSVTYVDVSSKLLSRIYAHIPKEILRKSPYAYLRVINDTLTSLDVRQGLEMLEDFEQCIPSYTVSQVKLNWELQLIYGYAHINDIYEMNACFKKAHAYFHGEVSRISNYGMNVTLGSPHTMHIYHRTPGDLDHLVSYIKGELQYYMDITGNLNAGFIEQAKAEQYLETGNFRQAIQKAWEAYYVARTYQQESIMICSLFTILRAASMTHDEETIQMMKKRLLQMLEHNDNIYQNFAIHSALGYCSAVNRNTEEAEFHLRQIENQTIIDTNYFTYIVKGILMLYQSEYEKLKSVAAVMMNFYQHEPHVLGEIYAHIFEAVCYYRQNKADIAKQKFQKAVDMSSPDGIVAPYLELYEEIEPLILLLLKHEHVKMIRHIHQKTDDGLSQYKGELTKKETEVARLLAKGYARKDIAVMLRISEETINTHAKKIFKKLKIHSRSDLLSLSLNNDI